MSKITLKIPAMAWNAIRAYHKHGEEKISFIHARLVRRKGTMVLLATSSPYLLADDCYVSNGSTHLKLYKDVTEGVVANFIDSDCDVLINIHNHPFSKSGTTFSGIDDRDDLALDRVLRPALKINGREFINLSIVLDRQSFDARLTNSQLSSPFQTIDEIQCLGDHLTVHLPNSQLAIKQLGQDFIDPSLSRQDFIPTKIQNWMRNAKVGIVGAGGLGSISAEGLVRMGFRNLTMVDDDTVEESNLNRLQTTKKSQVGIPKVKAMEDNLKAIAPDLNFTGIQSSLMNDIAMNEITNCDLIIGALDNSLPRGQLNQVSVQYQIPYFDAGVEIQLDPTNFRYRLFAVLPGRSACMQCSEFEILDNEEITHALLDPNLESEFRHRGYITDNPEAKAPSVYPLNMQASSALLTELLNYLCDFKPVATTVYSDYKDGVFQRTDRNIYPNNLPADDCPVCSFYSAQGDHTPLPFNLSIKLEELQSTIDFDEHTGIASIGAPTK